MTEINYELMSELIFTNDEVFDYIDINTAKILTCLCKNANSNKNVKLAFANIAKRKAQSAVNIPQQSPVQSNAPSVQPESAPKPTN
jgi:signal-transduction protein with cAMP-binding, CBS, and nucleotidyltransferase domain